MWFKRINKNKLITLVYFEKEEKMVTPPLFLNFANSQFNFFKFPANENYHSNSYLIYTKILYNNFVPSLFYTENN